MNALSLCMACVGYTQIMHSISHQICIRLELVRFWYLFILPYSSKLLPWRCGNRTTNLVPQKSTNFDSKYSHSTKQNKEKQCVYFVGFTVDWFYGMHVFITNYTGLVSWGWVGLWGFFWWAPSAKRKYHHGVSSGWSGTWFHSNTGLSSTQYEQIPIIFGVWPVWLTPFLFRSIKFWRVYG